jgi:hypothetical protein
MDLVDWSLTGFGKLFLDKEAVIQYWDPAIL